MMMMMMMILIIISIRRMTMVTMLPARQGNVDITTMAMATERNTG